MYAQMHMYTHTYLYTHACVHIHGHAHTHMYTHTCAGTLTCVHTYMQIYVYMCPNTLTDRQTDRHNLQRKKPRKSRRSNFHTVNPPPVTTRSAAPPHPPCPISHYTIRPPQPGLCRICRLRRPLANGTLLFRV